MAQHLEVRNTVTGVPSRPVGTSFYYPIADGQTIAQAQATFLADVARESKLLSALPALVPGATRTFSAFSTAFNYQAVAPQALPASNLVTTGSTAIELVNYILNGSAISQASGTGIPDMINRYDLGRLLGFAWYDKDAPYHPAGVNVYPGEFANIGYNPIEPGDIYGNPSAIAAYGVAADGTIYFKVIPKHWHLQNHPAPMTMEKWYKAIAPNVVRVWYKITHTRTDKTVQPESQEQEAPYVYSTAACSRYVYYEGQEPWTNGPVTERDGFNADGTHRADSDRLSLRIGEPWYAMVNPNTGRGMGIVGDHVYNITHRALGPSGSGTGPTSNNTGYAAAMLSWVPDNICVKYFQFDIVMGSVAEIRSHAASLPRPDNRPSYRFNSRSRFGLNYQKAYDQGEENIINQLTLTSRTGQMTFFTQDKGFPAAGITNYYIRIKVAGGRTDLAFTWLKAGSTGSQNHTIPFTVLNNGQFQTIAIPVGTSPNWSGTVVSIGVQYAGIREESAITNRIWDIEWFSYTNLST